MELRYRDVQERYRTMAMYNIYVSEQLPSAFYGCVGHEDPFQQFPDILP